MARLLDVLFFIFFFTHIPIALLVDFQSIVPRGYYPQQLVELKDWYCTTFRDDLMQTPPSWFKSLIYSEMFLQFPFFFIGSYAYFKGASNCKWIRFPAIVYGIHVATTLFPIFFYFMLQDASVPNYAGPRDIKERLSVMAFYFPYFLFPLLIALDGLFSSVYKTEGGESLSAKSRNKNGKSKKVKAN